MLDRRTRSRGACGNCKKRRRKCDLNRPECLACRSRHIPCDGYELKLQWGCGVASRGRLAGSALPVLDTSHDLGRQPTTAQSNTYLEYSVVHFPEHPNNKDSRILLESRPQLSESSEHNLILDQVSNTSEHVEFSFVNGREHEYDDHLLTKFFESGIYSLFATSMNDSFKKNLRQASKNSLALVSICRTYQLVYEQPETDEAHSKFRTALRIFHDELQERDGIINGGTLCAGLILCTLSIMQNLPWTNQLQCMVDLYCVHTSLGSSAPIPDTFTNHCLEVIGVMDLPGLVFGRKTPKIGFWERLREAERRSCHGLISGVEIVTGLPRSLLDILAYTEHRSAQLDLWNWHDEMGDSLQAQLWDAWRYAGILYRERVVAKIQSIDRDGVQEISVTGLPSITYILWRLITSLDSLRLGLEHPSSKGVLYGNSAFWPYLVARCNFGPLRKNPEWKMMLDKLFDMMLSSYKPRQIQVAQDMIQEAWERGDVTFDLDEAASSRDIELAAF